MRMPRPTKNWLKKDLLQRFAQDEEGGIIILSLFLFVIMLVVAGMSVDIMLSEQQRVRAQTTLDTAVVSASAVSQIRDPEQVVRDYMQAAGFEPSDVNVAPIIENTNGSTVTGRSVAASLDIETDTIFMNLLGIDALNSAAGGRAEEGTAEIEIAMVLDVSGSMEEDGKLDLLKEAARDFVTTVLANNSPDKVSFSIVPYNHQVYMSDGMRDNIENTAESDDRSRCAFFGSNGDFSRRSLTPGSNRITSSSIFVNDRDKIYERAGVENQPYLPPEEWSKWCNDDASRVELFNNNELQLHAYIDSLQALGGTAIDYGMKWGVAALDPSMRSTVSAMIGAGDLAPDVDGHPLDYGDDDVLKFILLMSDGINEEQYNLRSRYRDGLSLIRYSEDLAGGVSFTDPTTTSGYVEDGSDFGGYIVERPDKPFEERWFVPGDPLDPSDDYTLAEDALPVTDHVRLSYQTLYDRFTVMDLATYFFLGNGVTFDDYAAMSEAELVDLRDNIAQDFDEFVLHADGVYEYSDRSLMNNRTNRACNAAKEDERITVFTVAFDAPSGAQDVLRNCASGPENYFDARTFGSETTVGEAFATIAAQLSVLRIIN